MFLHYLIKEVLVVPPERAAHAADPAIHPFSGPAPVAGNEAAKGAAQDTQPSTLIQGDS
jgi:hypothetical protein